MLSDATIIQSISPLIPFSCSVGGLQPGWCFGFAESSNLYSMCSSQSSLHISKILVLVPISVQSNFMCLICSSQNCHLNCHLFVGFSSSYFLQHVMNAMTWWGFLQSYGEKNNTISIYERKASIKQFNCKLLFGKSWLCTYNCMPIALTDWNHHFLYSCYWSHTEILICLLLFPFAVPPFLW